MFYIDIYLFMCVQNSVWHGHIALSHGGALSDPPPRCTGSYSVGKQRVEEGGYNNVFITDKD